MIDYEYYHDQYRRVPRNSMTTQKDLIDYHSTASASTYNIWLESTRQPVATTYIDGSTLFNLQESPYGTQGLFPKGRNRRKPFTPCEKKANTNYISASLLSSEKTTVDTAILSTEKTRSSLSMTSTLPTVKQKSRDKRLYSAVVLDQKNSDAKVYGRRATTQANGGWVQRYKSINQTQTLTNLLRDQTNKDKTLFRKRTCQQIAFSSSSSISSLVSSLNKRRRKNG